MYSGHNPPNLFSPSQVVLGAEKPPHFVTRSGIGSSLIPSYPGPANLARSVTAPNLTRQLIPSHPHPNFLSLILAQRNSPEYALQSWGPQLNNFHFNASNEYFNVPQQLLHTSTPLTSHSTLLLQPYSSISMQPWNSISTQPWNSFGDPLMMHAAQTEYSQVPTAALPIHQHSPQSWNSPLNHFGDLMQMRGMQTQNLQAPTAALPIHQQSPQSCNLDPLLMRGAQTQNLAAINNVHLVLNTQFTTNCDSGGHAQVQLNRDAFHQGVGQALFPVGTAPVPASHSSSKEEGSGVTTSHRNVGEVIRSLLLLVKSFWLTRSGVS